MSSGDNNGVAGRRRKTGAVNYGGSLDSGDDSNIMSTVRQQQQQQQYAVEGEEAAEAAGSLAGIVFL